MKSASLHRHSHLRLLFLLLAATLCFTGYRACGDQAGRYGAAGDRQTTHPRPPFDDGGVGTGIATLTLKQAPQHVRRMIRHLKKAKGFQPPNGYKGGRVFQNRESTLPSGKTYYEFDVHPLRRGVPRGAERLVVDEKKSVFYYTKDHYQSFFKVQ